MSIACYQYHWVEPQGLDGAVRAAYKRFIVIPGHGYILRKHLRALWPLLRRFEALLSFVQVERPPGGPDRRSLRLVYHKRRVRGDMRLRIFDHVPGAADHLCYVLPCAPVDSAPDHFSAFIIEVAFFSGEVE